jgi:hypothetical protein
MMNKRELYGDMNRKFGNYDSSNDPDGKIIKVLKELMAEADVFINQHDAYGFHRDTHISKNYNPNRYGQSVIVDTAKFYSIKLNKEINLEEFGKRIVKRMNSQINEEKFHFCYWNHNSAENQKFADMQKSATYYALTNFSIPAFGLETSHDLPTLTHKVECQLVGIKEIMKEFEFDFPPIKVEQPQLYWLELEKNGCDILRVNSNTNVRLAINDVLRITKIFANYKSGLSANILNWGDINDLQKEFIFEKDHTIVVRKNNIKIGQIYLRHYRNNSVRSVNVVVNGLKKEIPNWGKIDVKKKDWLQLINTVPDLKKSSFELQGFQIKSVINLNQENKIHIKDLPVTFSFGKKGHAYLVKFYANDEFAGSFQIEVTDH